MGACPIRQLGDPILRETSSPVDFPSTASPILDDLRDTLHQFQSTHGFGRGISAVQIGVLKRVVYLEFEARTYCLINPRYASLSEEKFELWDDCFSLPELLVWLERSKSLRLSYTNESGAPQTLVAAGALSELIQHEMDHLDGILALDRAIKTVSACSFTRSYRPVNAGFLFSR